MAIEYQNGMLVYVNGQERFGLKGDHSLAVDLADWLDRDYLFNNGENIRAEEIYSNLRSSKNPDIAKIFVNALKLTAKGEFEGRSKIGILEDLAKEWQGDSVVLSLIQRTIANLSSRMRNQEVKPRGGLMERTGKCSLVNAKQTPDESWVRYSRD